MNCGVEGTPPRWNSCKGEREQNSEIQQSGW